MFIAYCSEICRHSEGQGTEALGPAAAAADAAAQCSFHVGKSNWAKQPGTTVPSSEWVLIELIQVLMQIVGD